MISFFAPTSSLFLTLKLKRCGEEDGTLLEGLSRLCRQISITWSRGFLPFIIMHLLFGCTRKVLIILCRLSNNLDPIKLFRRFVVGLQSPSSYRRLYALSIAIMIKRNENTSMWKQQNQFFPDLIPLIGIQDHIQNTAPSPPIL